MRKYIVAAVLLGGFVTPALALEAGSYYVGFDPATKKCLVMSTQPPAGMKMMGKFKSKAAAEKAMAGMKECKAG